MPAGEVLVFGFVSPAVVQLHSLDSKRLSTNSSVLTMANNQRYYFLLIGYDVANCFRVLVVRWSIFSKKRNREDIRTVWSYEEDIMCIPIVSDTHVTGLKTVKIWSGRNNILKVSVNKIDSYARGFHILTYVRNGHLGKSNRILSPAYVLKEIQGLYRDGNENRMG